jgi:hypothetical protein
VCRCHRGDARSDPAPSGGRWIFWLRMRWRSRVCTGERVRGGKGGRSPRCCARGADAELGGQHGGAWCGNGAGGGRAHACGGYDRGEDAYAAGFLAGLTGGGRYPCAAGWAASPPPR